MNKTSSLFQTTSLRNDLMLVFNHKQMTEIEHKLPRQRQRLIGRFLGASVALDRRGCIRFLRL